MVKLWEQQNQRTFSFLFGKIKRPEQFYGGETGTSLDNTKAACTPCCLYSSRTEPSKDEMSPLKELEVLLMTLQKPNLSVAFN